MDRRQAGSYGGLRRGSPLAGDVLYMACRRRRRLASP